MSNDDPPREAGSTPAIDPEIYPFQGRYFDRDGLNMHYLDEGQGDPVLMVHGNPSWSIYYRNLVQALRGSHRTIVPDHIGCGLSDKPDEARYTHTLSNRVADLGALVDHLQLDRPLTLVLHDWGGMIGMAWAVQHPERVARVVLLNTAAFRNPKDQQVPLPLWLARDTALGAFLVKRLNAFAAGATRLAVTRPMRPALRRAYCAPYDTPAHRHATLRFVQDIPLQPGDPAWDLVLQTEQGLARLADRPTLICWGMRDFVFDVSFLHAWRDRVPKAEVHTFPEAGHYVLEDAGDQIEALVIAFLQAHPLSGIAAGPDVAPA